MRFNVWSYDSSLWQTSGRYELALTIITILQTKPLNMWKIAPVLFGLFFLTYKKGGEEGGEELALIQNLRF